MFDLLVSILVRVAALQVLVGWLLSLVSGLTPAGYLWVDAPLTLCVVAASWRWRARPARWKVFHRGALWWRHGRGLPLVFAVIFVLAALGACLHEPNNFDALSYRVPRMLFWLEQRRWHWIDTPYGGLNSALPNYEWLCTPLFLLTGGLKALAAIDLVSFLLLPPLVFGLLRRFAVSPRLAFDWMWLLPAAYGIALQAGSVGNDLPGLTALLAALHFAGQFAGKGRKGDLFDALLATGLCTGIKISNLPLAALTGILLIGSWRQIRVAWRTLAAGLTAGVLVSAAVPLALNLAHTGSILGVTKSDDQTNNPLAGLMGNGLILLVNSLMPPVLPGAQRLALLLNQALPGPMSGWLRHNYVKFIFIVNELPQEEMACLGLGTTLALAACFVLWYRSRLVRTAPGHTPAGLCRWQRLVWCGWLAFSALIVLSKLGTGPAVPRNLLPWMPVALAPLLGVVGGEFVTRSRWWWLAAWFAMLGVLPSLILNPSRPLIPPSLILAAAKRLQLKESALTRLDTTYAVYRQRADPFADLRNALPATATKLGLVTDGWEPTASWQRPYGARTLVYLRNAREVAAARAAGVQFVVLRETDCLHYFNLTTAVWADTFQARILMVEELKLSATKPSMEHYTLVRLSP